MAEVHVPVAVYMVTVQCSGWKYIFAKQILLVQSIFCAYRLYEIGDLLSLLLIGQQPWDMCGI